MKPNASVSFPVRAPPAYTTVPAYGPARFRLARAAAPPPPGGPRAGALERVEYTRRPNPIGETRTPPMTDRRRPKRHAPPRHTHARDTGKTHHLILQGHTRQRPPSPPPAMQNARARSATRKEAPARTETPTCATNRHGQMPAKALEPAELHASDGVAATPTATHSL